MRIMIARKLDCRNSNIVAVLTLACTLFAVPSAHSQCDNQITLVPPRPLKAASAARDFVRFKYPLSASDSLLILSHEDTETSIGPFDTGFSIKRNGKVSQRISLRNVPEIRREDREYANSFSSLAVTRACGSAGPIFFVTMQYQGDLTSPALLFVLVPSKGGYDVSTPPTISGGVFEISLTNPFHLKAWDNLHEGNCEACETAYEISDYLIQNGKLVLTGKHRTRRLYASGQFDDRRRVRFAR